MYCETEICEMDIYTEGFVGVCVHACACAYICLHIYHSVCFCLCVPVPLQAHDSSVSMCVNQRERCVGEIITVTPSVQCHSLVTE